MDNQSPTSAELEPGGAFGSFESRAGKKLAILHWNQPWRSEGVDQAFQTEHFDNVRKHGSIPLLSWGSWEAENGPTQPDFKLSTIILGQHDSYIRQWALDAKAWGHPFFLRFDWQMNGNWLFPWSAQLNGNTAIDYILAWRHVHDLFTQVGAANVTWVWCPNISSRTTVPYTSLYPGDSFVDWTCFDGYNFYDTWLGLDAVFTGSGINWLQNSYQQILSVAPTKPIMIGETASIEARDAGSAKAAWIADAYGNVLPNHLRRVKAVLWFNWVGYRPVRPTIPVESSPASIAAFASAIGSNIYRANEFANLDASPISPP